MTICVESEIWEREIGIGAGARCFPFVKSNFSLNSVPFHVAVPLTFLDKKQVEKNGVMCRCTKIISKLVKIVYFQWFSSREINTKLIDDLSGFPLRKNLADMHFSF